MKFLLVLLIMLISLFSCEEKKRPLKGDTAYQKHLNATFKDASSSPLKAKDRKIFEGLDFFKTDSTYVVSAILNRTPDSEWFQMKTTTDRVSEERVYGILSFVLKGETYQLNVYQSKALQQENDYLFLPFLDETNGFETYGGGRYLDIKIPERDTLTLDFNKAYNPYCAYNEKYSCPIVPRENYLKIKIEAGVKVFKKH